MFLCNSGTEAVENALKMASFHTKKKHVIAFKNAFHGRTSGAVSITDNKAIQTSFKKAKLDNAIRALKNGVNRVKIGNPPIIDQHYLHFTEIIL